MTKPSKTEQEKKQEKKQEQRYGGEVLAKSKHFHDVQQDFCRTILGDKSYTIQEAKDKLSEFLERS